MVKDITKEILGRIGKYIVEGLTEEESCILSDVKYTDLTKLKENNEDIRDYISKQMVEFKYAHLKEMQTKKSEKTSQWLLERLRPEDFYIGSKKNQGNTTVNIIGTIIRQIQNDDNSISLISKTREDVAEKIIEAKIIEEEDIKIIDTLN